ncbi:MAG TPA: RagB/SusD family nutrient uptake outer membrane protein [Gemmatimonadales bacterium]
MNSRLHSTVLGLALVLGSAGCADFLTVENPGSVLDDDLNTVTGMPGLVTGMSFDLSRALDEVLQNSSVMGDDLFHGGSYGPQGLFNRGVIDKENVNGMWGEMHRARWVAEQGIVRMQQVLETDFDASALAVRAYILAGLANRLLGEHVCDAVIDGGAREPNTVHFQRAEAQFTEALRIAQNLTSSSLRDSLSRVAYGGRASVRAWQGNWTEAASDAAQVPTGYVFVAFYGTNTGAENNDLVFETTTRFEYTIYNSPWAQVFGDPRARWDTVKTTSGAIRTGQDGRTPFFQQKKFLTLATDVPLVKGTEMLVLRAEAALRSGDVPGAMALINQQRAFYDPGRTVLPDRSAATAAEAWPVLQFERAAVLWIEGRRFWDLRRWNAEAAPIHHPFLDTRDQCIPVSENEEQSNPNF